MTATTGVGRHRLVVKQTKEWGEILSGFETRNRFEIFDEHGTRVALAAEEAAGFGAMLLRSFLGQCRASTVHVTDPSGAPIAVARKPFRLYFHRIEAFEGERKVGAVQRKFSLLHRKFVVENANGDEVLEIVSPLFRIWTFRLVFQGREVGVIRKQWGGMLREMFTDADAFGIEYDGGGELGAMRSVLLAATFLIDFTCFEENKGSGGMLGMGD